MALNYKQMALLFLLFALGIVQIYGILLPKKAVPAAPKIIDLRSDTVTKPSPAMRKAMSEAEVGDDVFGEDPTVNLLEERVAGMFNKEKALFVPTGTMGNLLAIMSWCGSRGSEMILGDCSHVHLFEQGGMSQFGGVASKLLPNKHDGTIDLDQIENSIRSQNIHFPITELIAIENTHNYCGGRVLSSGYVEALGWLCESKGVPLHVDGARIWNAAAATGQTLEQLTSSVSSASVCLSKGLGAPAGSLLVGPKDFIKRARRLRKALGGGMRQAGILAAAGLQALDDFESGILGHDHRRAQMIASALSSIPGLRIDGEGVQSNILLLHLDYQQSTVQTFVDRLKERNVLLLSFGPQIVRLVVHRDITDEDCINAINAIREVAAICWVEDDTHHTGTAITLQNVELPLSNTEEVQQNTELALVLQNATSDAPLVPPFSNASAFEEAQVFGMSVSDQGFCVFLQGLICDRFIRIQVTPSDPMVYGLDKDQAESSEAVTLLQLLQGIDVESFLPKDALSSRFTDGKLKYKLKRVVVEDVQEGGGFKAKLYASAKKLENNNPEQSENNTNDDAPSNMALPRAVNESALEISMPNNNQEPTTSKSIMKETDVKSPFITIALALRHHAPLEVRSDYFHNEEISYTLEELRQDYPRAVYASNHQPLLQQVDNSTSVAQSVSRVNSMIERLQRLLSEARRQRNEQKVQLIANRLEMLEKIVAVAVEGQVMASDSMLIPRTTLDSSSDLNV